jgi:hypothetical protein
MSGGGACAVLAHRMPLSFPIPPHIGMLNQYGMVLELSCCSLKASLHHEFIIIPPYLSAKPWGKLGDKQ